MKRLCISFFVFLNFTLLFANDYFEITIIGAPSATVEDAKAWARNRNAAAFFVDLADLYWEQAVTIGINPVIAYCQAAKETGYGRFGGIVDASFYNPCGIKATGKDGDAKSDHMKFDSWIDGVEAHLDHLALYVGLDGYPKEDTKDPRHHKYLKGVARTVKQMSSRWAMSRTYGEELARMIKGLEKTAMKQK